MAITKATVLKCTPSGLKKAQLIKYCAAVNLDNTGTAQDMKFLLGEYIKTEERKLAEHISSDDGNKSDASTDELAALRIQVQELLNQNKKSTTDILATDLIAAIKRTPIHDYDSEYDERTADTIGKSLFIRSKLDEKRFRTYTIIEQMACGELDISDLQTVYNMGNLGDRSFMALFHENFGHIDKIGVKEDARLLYWMCERLRILFKEQVTLQKLQVNALCVMEVCMRQIYRHTAYCQQNPQTYQSTMNVLPRQLHSSSIATMFTPDFLYANTRPAAQALSESLIITNGSKKRLIDRSRINSPLTKQQQQQQYNKSGGSKDTDKSIATTGKK